MIEFSMSSKLDIKRKKVESDPYNSKVQFELGEALVDADQYEESIACFEKTIELDSDSKIAYMYLVHSCKMIENTDRAIQFLEDMVKKRSDDSHAHFHLGCLFHSNKEYERSVDHLRKSIELDDLNMKAMDHLGAVYIEMKRYNDAFKMFESVLELYPEDSDALANLALVCYYRRDYNDAIRMADKALEINPDNATAYLAKARSHEDTYLLDEALENYLEAINSDPTLHIARDLLGSLYCKLKQYDAALKQFLKLKEASPSYELNHDYFTQAEIEVNGNTNGDVSEFSKNEHSEIEEIISEQRDVNDQQE